MSPVSPQTSLLQLPFKLTQIDAPPYYLPAGCWKSCNIGVTERIGAPWISINLNHWSYISRNCEYDLYLESMGKCLVNLCESCWDVQYAVEYGEMMCRKAVSRAEGWDGDLWDEH